MQQEVAEKTTGWGGVKQTFVILLQQIRMRLARAARCQSRCTAGRDTHTSTQAKPTRQSSFAISQRSLTMLKSSHAASRQIFYGRAPREAQLDHITILYGIIKVLAVQILGLFACLMLETTLIIVQMSGIYTRDLSWQIRHTQN